MPDEITPASDSDSVTTTVTGLPGNNGAGSDADSFTTAVTGTPENHGQNIVRKWRDVFWLAVFEIHSVALVIALGVSGVGCFGNKDGFKLQQLGEVGHLMANKDLTEFYWKFFAVSTSVGGLISMGWLLLLRSISDYVMKMSLHILTAYFTMISVSCFWNQYTFWAVLFAVVTCFHVVSLVSVSEKISFSLFVLKKSVKIVWDLGEVMRVTYAFLVIMFLWLALWTFGVSGVLASCKGGVHGWIVVLELSVSLVWTNSVLSGVLRVAVSRVVYQFVHDGGRGDESVLCNLLFGSLHTAVTTSFGSVCYGSVCIVPIEVLRTTTKCIRSRIETNECFSFLFDLLFYFIEILVRFFNKYAYVQFGINGKNFNYSSRDAWEQFQSTAVEALVSYDCSGTILWMSTILCGLITGTCAATLSWFNTCDKVAMVGATSMLIGMFSLGLQCLWWIVPQVQFIHAMH